MRFLHLGQGPFVDDWAAAMRLVADVIVIEHHRDCDHEAFGRTPYLRVASYDPPIYHLLPPREPPYRLARRLAWMGTVRRWVRVIDELQLRHGSVDGITAHFFPSARHLPAVRRATGIPFMVIEHSSSFTEENPTNRLGRFGQRIAADVFASASVVVVVSHSLLAHIRRWGLAGNYHVIPNPIDVEVFAPPSDAARLRLPKIVNVARLSQVKRQDVLLAAIAELHRRGFQSRLAIVGDGPERARLMALCDELGLTGSVQLAGRLDKRAVARELADASVFVLPSRTENLSVAVIEALCVGVPVVASNVGGLTELVGTDDGLLIPVGNDVALADAIEAALDRPWDRDQISRRAAARFALTTIAAELAPRLSEVVATRLSPSRRHTVARLMGWI